MRRNERGVHFMDLHISHMRYLLKSVSLFPDVRESPGGFRAVVG